MLTASGNGEGLGDFQLPHDPVLDLYPKQYKHWEEAEKAGWKPRDRMPMPQFRLVGSWAGDRIVTAGEYARSKKWVTKEDHLAAEVAIRAEELIYSHQEERPPDEKSIRARIARINLYCAAHACYENISDEAADVLGLCGIGPRARADKDHNWYRELEQILSRFLLHDFNHDGIGSRGKAIGEGKKQRFQHDLTWLTIEMIDSLVRTNSDNAKQLNSLKKWLKQQQLSPMIRELLPCYKADRTKSGEAWSERHNFPKIQQIMRKYRCSSDEEKRWTNRVLPTIPIQKAAMQVHAMMRDLAYDVHGKSYVQLLAQELGRIATEESQTEAGVPQQRVVDLTGIR
jgi:hypothetical protein